MDDDTKARLRASDANLAGVIAGRRRAAQALLAVDQTPAQETRAGWEPLRLAKRDAPIQPDEYREDT